MAKHNRTVRPVPPPDPVDEALEEMDLRATITAARYEDDLSDRLRARKALPNEGYDVWDDLPAGVKARLEALVGPTAEEYEGGATDVRDPATITPEMFDGLVRTRDASEVQAQLRDADDKQYVWLFDPPVGGYHRSKSRVHVTQMKSQLKMGKSPTAYAPIWPRPQVRCTYVTPNGVECPKLLENDEELFAHQRSKHHEWYLQDEARRARNREELLLRAMQTLAERGVSVPSEPVKA